MSDHPDIAVVCSLCGTRLHARTSQIGKGLKCPDCYTVNVVKEPPAKPKKHSPAADSGAEYRLADESHEIIELTCTSCHDSIRTRSENAGRKVRCPKCDAANVVPRHPSTDGGDTLELAAESTAAPTKKQIAERLMARAREEVAQTAERDEPEIPVQPFVDGVLNFPLRSNILPIWMGMAICIVVMGLLLDKTVELLTVHSYAMVGGLFVGLLFGIVLIFSLMYFSPLMLSITEVTAMGRDKIEFSESDFLDRLHVLFLIFNAAAFGSMPGLLFVSGLGVTKWLGLCSTIVLFPICLLSMLESASPWNLFSSRIRHSFSAVAGSWLMFYTTTIPMTAGSLLLTGSIFSADQKWIALGVLALSFPVVSVMYFRILGRLALMIGNAEIASDMTGLTANG